MPELPQPNSAFHGAHYTHIRDALPDWLTHATPGRLGALKAAGVKHLTAPAPLKAAIAEHWQQQNRLDQRLAGLNDVYAFAEPLLKHALRDYGNLDVRNTYLRLYVDAKTSGWKLNVTGAQVSKTFSLLDAALYNFAADQTFLDFAFLGPTDARGQRDVLHEIGGQPRPRWPLPDEDGLARDEKRGIVEAARIDRDQVGGRLGRPEQQAPALRADVAHGRMSAAAPRPHLLDGTLAGERTARHAHYRHAAAA